MKIEVSNDYKKFKTLKGNRPIVPGKIKKLVKSVKDGLNLFQYNPVMVNQDMYVIDGQHRLEACKALKLPVYYVIVPKITLLQIAELNSLSSRWKNDDFFNCFIEGGNKDYQALKLFMEKYNIKLSVAVSLLMHGSAASGGAGENFKAGTFAIRHALKAKEIMETVCSYSPVAEDSIISDRNFIRAVQLLMASDLYNHKEVIAKLVTHKCELVKKLSHKEYMLHIEEQFNKKNSIRRSLFKSTK